MPTNPPNAPEVITNSHENLTLRLSQASSSLALDPNALVPDISGVLNVVGALHQHLATLEQSQKIHLEEEEMEDISDLFDHGGLSKEEIEAINAVAPVGQRLEDVVSDMEVDTALPGSIKPSSGKRKGKIGRPVYNTKDTNHESHDSHELKTPRRATCKAHGSQRHRRKGLEGKETSPPKEHSTNTRKNRKRKRGLEAEIASLHASRSVDFQ